MATVTEFIYFQVKPSVKPEDPSSEDGLALFRIFQATTQQSGYNSSAWGRAIEDDSIIIWVVDWSDAHGSTQPSLLTPFLQPNTQISTVFTNLQPPISETKTLTTNPVTELCALTFPSTLTAQERSSLCEELIQFRTVLLDEAPEKLRPRSFAVGQVERPGTVEYDKSPSGLAFVHLAVIGWESVDVHVECKGTEQFGKAIAPIRGKMVPPLPGLGMKHVRFQSVEGSS